MWQWESNPGQERQPNILQIRPTQYITNNSIEVWECNSRILEIDLVLHDNI